MNDLDSEAGTSLSKRTFKIVLMGEMQTGKTSIINRFTSNKFNEIEHVPRLLHAVYSRS